MKLAYSTLLKRLIAQMIQIGKGNCYNMLLMVIVVMIVEA